MSIKAETVTIRFIDDAVIQGFNVDSGSEATYCVLRDGKYPNHLETFCFFLGEDGLWGRRNGKLFQSGLEARRAFAVAGTEARIERYEPQE